MFDYIRGNLVHVQAEYIVVECGSIGYQIICPNPFIWQDYFGEEVTVFTYQYVREDILALYGFTSRDEKYLFTKLISVSGIGPKGALAILAAGQPDQVIQAIENEQEQFLTKFPGVGKKTARQIILDLKGKLTKFESVNFVADTKIPINSASTALDEAVEALESLGYAQREIKKITPLLEGVELSTDQYIKKALQLLLKT